MNAQSKWTPGPWTVVNDGTADEPMMSVKAARIAGKPPKHEVALCATGDSPQEMEAANARLIAAAPELYQALDVLLHIFCDLPAANNYGEVVRHARAALAKAA